MLIDHDAGTVLLDGTGWQGVTSRAIAAKQSTAIDP